jgi:carboxymethylenebutenolidase
MDPKIVELHDSYLHDDINRREFMRQLGLLAGGAVAASALLPLLDYNYAQAAIVAPDDGRLQTGEVSYAGASGDMKAYTARPKGAQKLPAVLVVHENRGLNPHIKDVARRIALAGFLAMAPDALSASGGTPPVEKEAIAMIRKLDMGQTLKNFLAATAYLKTNPQSTGKVGVVGFCWGGAMANQLAVNSPHVVAAVPYYGRQPKAEDVPKIKAALLLHYGGEDARINKGIPDYEAALKKAGVNYKLYVYEGAKHAFNNDTNAARYHKEAAELAWKRTIDFFEAQLK